jgi:hypothetical protein
LHQHLSRALRPRSAWEILIFPSLPGRQTPGRQPRGDGEEAGDANVVNHTTDPSLACALTVRAFPNDEVMMIAADTHVRWKHLFALLGLSVFAAPACAMFAPPRAPPIAKQINGDFTSPLTPDLLHAVDGYRDAVKRAG